MSMQQEGHCVYVFDGVYKCLLGSQIYGQIKGGWQQEEDFQAQNNGTALENEMSLVPMAANETFLYIHIRECEHKDVDDRQEQKHGRGSQGWSKTK